MKMKFVYIVIPCLAIFSMVFQNCGSNVSFNETANSENPFGVGETRVLKIDPNLSENRPPIHLTTIVDNSFSTSEIHDNLIQGFSKAIDQVKGFNVVSSLYTTSNDAGSDKNSTEVRDVVTYLDNNGREIELPKSQINLVPPNTSYSEKTIYALAPSFFPNRQSLRYFFTLDDFLSFKTIYSDSIAQLGTNGADEEKGLCTLIKKVEENNNTADPDNRAYHIYILASNEDDSTTLANCPLETVKDTIYVEQSQTMNCNSSDPDCLFSYQIQQNGTINKSVKLNYSKPQATIKVAYAGNKITETYVQSNETAAHAISFEKKEATYSYSVVKYCPKDNIPVPCASAIVKSKVVNGSCSFSGSRVCNSGDQSDALSLFSINSNDLYSCQVSCNESWKAQNLPVASIPNNSQLCGSTLSNCDSNELNIVANYANSSSNAIRSCEHKCTKGTNSKNKTYTNRIASCTTSSRVCTSAEISSISAPLLGVPASSVNSCQYSCSQSNSSGSKTLSNNTLSCSASDTRACTASDRNWLINTAKVGILDSNLNTCSVSCTESTTALSLNLPNENVSQCPSTSSCNSQHLQLAANQFGGSPSDVKSCQLSCTQSTQAKPACVLSDIKDSQLCLSTNTVTNLCSQKGATDLNLSSCSQTKGSKTITSYTKQTGSLTTKKISDLPGVNKNGSMTDMIADRLKAVHGQKGFYSNFFIYPSSNSNCVAPGYLSSGLKYEQLSSALTTTNSQTYPLCLTDYSPALDNLIKVAIESVLTTFNLEIHDTEQVFKITAQFLDGSKKEIPESEYDLFKKTVIFKNKAFLKDVVSLEFSVWRP